MTHTTSKPAEPIIGEDRVVLLVDDNPRFVHRVSLELEACGYVVLTASDGSDALLSMRDIRPDAVVSDLQMPGMDGLQLCRALRELHAFDSVPLVICTSTPRDDSRVRAAMAVPDVLVVHKPMDGYELADVLDDVLAADVELDGTPARSASPSLSGAHGATDAGGFALMGSPTPPIDAERSPV